MFELYRGEMGLWFSCASARYAPYIIARGGMRHTACRTAKRQKAWRRRDACANLFLHSFAIVFVLLVHFIAVRITTSNRIHVQNSVSFSFLLHPFALQLGVLFYLLNAFILLLRPYLRFLVFVCRTEVSSFDTNFAYFLQSVAWMQPGL